MPKCSVIVSGSIHVKEKVDTYKSVAGPIMKKYGATMPPQSYKVSDVIAGEARPSFILKIDFLEREQAVAAFNDPEYLSVIKERDEGFGDLSIFIAE